jgi:predicted tellurium resistance membrane protein TerC
MPDIMAIFSAEGLVSLLTLVVMEIVLGIDNIIFISIVAGKLPAAQQAKARRYGLVLALLMRVVLLFCISWIAGMQEPLFTVFGMGFSVRNIVLLAGGLFLLFKATTEIHGKIEAEEVVGGPRKSFRNVVFQIIILDIVFSIDSILTAVGLVTNVAIMIIAVLISLIIMLLFSGTVSDFIHKHPGIKMLALAFLLMIGFLLMAEALPEPYSLHIPRAYVYSAMGFSFLVELLNIRARKGKK